MQHLFAASSTAAVLVALIAVGVAYIMWPFTNHFDPKDKHCYVTGGSQGMGRALAMLLVKRGAHVTVVARGQKALDETVEELQAHAQPNQRIHAISADLTSPTSSESAIQQASDLHGGKCPECVFLCAGASRPKWFIDLSAEELDSGMQMTYYVQAYTALAAVKRQIAQRVQGAKVVFVASFLGYTSFAGYTPYSPGKFAIRGLADALRSEMLAYTPSPSIHVFMPAGIDSPGYLQEQLHKPPPTKKLEEGDRIDSPEMVALCLIKGLQRGEYQPTSYFITDLVRMQCRGAVPANGLLDPLLWLVGGIGLPIWRMFADMTVRSFRKEREAELVSQGYYKGASSSS